MAALTFLDALAQAEACAKQGLPDALHARLSCAVALVKAGAVTQQGDRWAVASQTTPGKVYTINGGCQCEDAHYRAPKGLCKHMLATFVARKAAQLMVANTAAVPAETTVPSIPQEYLITVHGKPFVRYAGLLALAHQRGLQELKVRWVYNDADLSLAEATAVFPFGTYQEAGDASPTNVKKEIAPSFRRMALTRAAARVLRNALSVDACSVEELADHE